MVIIPSEVMNAEVMSVEVMAAEVTIIYYKQLEAIISL